MNILLISNTCSKGEFARIQKIKNSEKVSPQQNFFSMLVEGLLENKEIERVICIAVRPIAQSNSNVDNLVSWNEQISERLSFVYTRIISKNVRRNMVNFLETRRVIREILQSNASFNRTNTAAIIDPLAFDLTFGAITALGDIPAIAVVTDIPMFIGAIGKSSGVVARLKSTFKQWMFKGTINKMEGYCFLTEAMNYINAQCKPYCVVEGMVPMTMHPPVRREKSETRVVMYAGGLYEKFGIINLVEAARGVFGLNFELHLYGEGNCVDYINHVHSSSPNIIYKGVVGIDEIKEAERNATLLVNPRPCNEEFTKFSFPSKTLEYMASGRPVLTTKLPGIPAEYFDYVYSIEDNSVALLRDKLSELLSLSGSVLDEKGERAQKFVAENKNAKIQVGKIIRMLKGMHNGSPLQE